MKVKTKKHFNSSIDLSLDDIEDLQGRRGEQLQRGSVLSEPGIKLSRCAVWEKRRDRGPH